MTLTICGKISNGCTMGNKCCMKTKKIENDDEDMCNSSEFLPYDPSQEPIFPPELMVRNKNNIFNYLLYKYLHLVYLRSLQMSSIKNI